MDSQEEALNRRRFLRLLALVGVGLPLASCGQDELVSQVWTAVPTTGPIASLTATRRPTFTAMSTATPTEVPSATATEAASRQAPSAGSGQAPTATSSEQAPTETQAPTDTATVQPTAESTATPGPAYLAAATGGDPGAAVRAALAAIGGMERFVRPGANVIVKPNVCVVPPSYEYAYTTNPVVVGALVELCLAAGAGRVRVMDRPFGGPAGEAYVQSGIAEAVVRAGGETEVMQSSGYRRVEVPEGQRLGDMEIYDQILDADLVINVPIAKHHNTTGLTLGCKNLLGVVPNPGRFHDTGDLHQAIADLVSAVRPALTVVDAVRILTNWGPASGTLSDVQKENTVVASHDVVAADSYATRFFLRTPQHIGYIKKAAAMGLGTMDLDAVRVEEIRL